MEIAIVIVIVIKVVVGLLLTKVTLQLYIRAIKLSNKVAKG